MSGIERRLTKLEAASVLTARMPGDVDLCLLVDRKSQEQVVAHYRCEVTGSFDASCELRPQRPQEMNVGSLR